MDPKLTVMQAMDLKSKRTSGHFAALVTILVWGTTLIFTKALLADFQPIEILFFRFTLGLLALLLVCPHRLKGTTFRQECTFLIAGFFGVCLYYLLENIALVYSMASNVGVILSAAPFFTALFSRAFTKSSEKLRGNFFAGFVVAMAGIALISFNGAKLQLNPLGDLLALCAAICWALYSLFIKKISGFGHNTILATRHVIFYGLICMIPALFFFDFKLELSRLMKTTNLLHFLFLGFCASALCFVTWNTAIKLLGPVKTTTYIYIIPIVTVIASALFLHEKITPLAIAGTALILTGLILSEGRNPFRRSKATEPE